MSQPSSQTRSPGQRQPPGPSPSPSPEQPQSAGQSQPLGRPRPARIVVLVSGTGSNLAALLEACAEPAYGARIVAVGADRAGIRALEVARRAGVPAFTVEFANYPDRASWDRALAAAITEHQPDLVVSAGFMRLLGPAVLAGFAGRIVNTHPALLPAFPGRHAVREALAYGVKLTGCTVHLVDAGVDTGPVIAQATVAVEPGDDEAGLHERIKTVERVLLVEVVGRMVREGYTVAGRRVSIP